MRKKRVLGLILILLGLINLFYFANIYLIEERISQTGFVSKIIDGDTVIIDGESVRLLGIDTDEKGSPCWSSAKNRISELLLNKEVNLEQGPEDRDLYDRKLRYIFLNNQNINLQLVEEGLAVARFSGKNEKYQIEITAAEKIAREKKIGCKWMNYSNSPNI